MIPAAAHQFVTYTVNGFACKYQRNGDRLYMYVPPAAVLSCGSLWELTPRSFFLKELSMSPDNPSNSMVELVGILDKEDGEDEPEKQCDHVYVNVSFAGLHIVCKWCGEERH